MLVAWFSLMGGLCGVGESAAFGFDIRVRAESQLEVSVTAAGTLVRVDGSLRDGLGDGLGERSIQVVFVNTHTGEMGHAGAAEPIYTDRRGNFTATGQLDPGRWRVVVHFQETEHVTASRAAKTVEVAAAPADVTIDVPEQAVGPVDSAPVRIRASVGGVGLPSGAVVRVGGARVARVDLDQFGRATADIGPYLNEGTNHIEVRIPPAAHREVARTTAAIRLSEHLEIRARLNEVVERLQTGLAVEGRVSDDLGPVGGMRLKVSLDRRPPSAVDSRASSVASGQPPARRRVSTTDTDGRFEVFFDGDHLGEGTWQARVTAVPPVGRQSTATTDTVVVDRTTARWVLNGLGLVALVGGLALILQRLWVVIEARVQRRRKDDDERRRVEQAFRDTDPLTPVALGPDQAPVDATHDHGCISGMLWDVWRDRPVGGATVVVESPDGADIATQTTSDDHSERRGVFVIDGLDGGAYTVDIRADGFMPGVLSIDIPHDGRLTNMRIDLVAIPLKIRRLYGALVELIDGRDLWGRLSPRQIQRAVAETADWAVDRAHTPVQRQMVDVLKRRLRGADQRLDADDLMALMTSMVEETYYSGRTFDRSVWTLARDVASQLRQRFTEERS